MFNLYLDNVSQRQLFADADFKQMYQGQYGSKAIQQGRAFELMGVIFCPTTEALTQTHPTNSALTVRRPILVAQGALVEGDFAGMTEKAHQITDLVHTSKELNANPPASNQPIYSMLSRGIEDGVLQTCEQFGIGNVVFSPLAQGVLTGKYLPGQPAAAGTRAADSTSNAFMARFMEEETLERVQKLKSFAEEQGHGLTEFALAWCLRQKMVSSVIIGATNVSQVETNVKASGIQFDASVWERAEQILAGQ